MPQERTVDRHRSRTRGPRNAARTRDSA